MFDLIYERALHTFDSLSRSLAGGSELPGCLEGLVLLGPSKQQLCAWTPGPQQQVIIAEPVIEYVEMYSSARLKYLPQFVYPLGVVTACMDRGSIEAEVKRQEVLCQVPSLTPSLISWLPESQGASQFQHKLNPSAEVHFLSYPIKECFELKNRSFFYEARLVLVSKIPHCDNCNRVFCAVLNFIKLKRLQSYSRWNQVNQQSADQTKTLLQLSYGRRKVLYSPLQLNRRIKLQLYEGQSYELLYVDIERPNELLAQHYGSMFAVVFAQVSCSKFMRLMELILLESSLVVKGTSQQATTLLHCLKLSLSPFPIAGKFINMVSNKTVQILCQSPTPIYFGTIAGVAPQGIDFTVFDVELDRFQSELPPSNSEKGLAQIQILYQAVAEEGRKKTNFTHFDNKLLKQNVSQLLHLLWLRWKQAMDPGESESPFFSRYKGTQNYDLSRQSNEYGLKCLLPYKPTTKL